MGIRKTALLCCSLSALYSYSQEPAKNSISLKDTQNLKTVVVTGQYNQQSVDKSVFEVRVLTQTDLRNMAGNTLADVLTQSLNLNVIPNAGEGRAGIQQFGFNSQYVKILIDGVPIMGDEGFGNAIDISQINLNDVKQIEIVEGAMGVAYGANAVTGVVNIITKKKSKYNWEVSPYVQEETVGGEYRWFDRGRHIQSLKIGHNFSEDWYADLTYTRNDFDGFLGRKKGENYFNPDDANDGLRGHEWLPKQQNNLKALINYHRNDLRFFYKFEYFHEKTDKYAHNVHLNPNNATMTINPTANDELYRTTRLYHNLTVSGKLFDRTNFSLTGSYQEQKRNVETYTYRIKNGEKSNRDRYDYNTRQGFFSRGTINNFIDSKHFNIELGYAVNLDKGTASGLTSQNASTDTKTNHINTYSGFVSAEINASDRLSLRPGFRYMESIEFAPQYALSFSGKYRFDNGYLLRAIIGTSPKTPTFEQLYFYLVDSNHDVRGNENLRPEKGKSIFLHFKKTFLSKDYKLSYTPKLSVWYLDVDDKIDLIIVSTASLAYEYNNIDLYRTMGIAFRNTFSYDNFTASLGLAVSGESKLLQSVENSDDDYLYGVQANAQVSYRVPKWETVFSAYLKYNGPQYQFVSRIDGNGNSQVFKERQEDYVWLNVSVRKAFFDKALEVSLGGRNLLNVRSIKTGPTSGSGHSAGSSALLLGYGASAFLKLQYTLNF